MMLVPSSHHTPISFKTLFEALPGLYLIVDRDLTIVAASDAYLSATKTRREEITGRGIFDVFPDNPSDPEATGVRNLHASLMRVLHDKIADTMAVQKYDIRKPDSEGGGFEERYWSPINSPILNGDKEILYIIHRVEDVTDFVHLKQKDAVVGKTNQELRAHAEQVEIEIYLRSQEIQEINRQLAAAKAQVDSYAKRLEGKAAAAEERHQLLMEHARDGFFVLSEDGSITDVNVAGEKLLGKSRTDIIGTPFNSYLMVESLLGNAIGLAHGSPDNSINVESTYLKQPAGKKVYVDISLSHVNIAGTHHILCIARDITDHAKLQETLRQAQKMEAVGQLTGGIAHDFNNLLGIIVGNLDLMQLETTEKGEKLRLSAVGAAIRGSDLVRSLLAFSRRQPLNPSVVNVNDHINQMIEFLSRALGEQIEIKWLPGKDIWPVLIDPVQLEAAMTNLAINARDATPKGGQVLITTQNTELDFTYTASNPEVAAGEYLRISVADTGSGMPAHILKHVFEPFFTTKEEGKGTGLGLSMVYGFIKQSGGHIKIYSEPGHGTTIHLYLPRHLNSEEEKTVHSVHEAIEGGNETILVVEDNPDMRAMAIQQLQSLGYKTIEATNGLQALAVINSGIPFHLLFSDIIMPGGLSGFELARQVQAHHPHIHILLTSGFPGPIMADRQGSIPNMHIGLLNRPYRKEELAIKLREAFKNKMSEK